MSTEERDWFAPPPTQATQPPAPPSPPPGQPSLSRPARPQPTARPPAGARPPMPDQQVWPPVQRGESVGSSTQPIPAIPSAGPLPQRHRQPPEPPPPPPSSTPEPEPEPEPAPAAPAPRRRPMLRALLAAAMVAVAVGAITYDRYDLYEKRTGKREIVQVHQVKAGQPITIKHMTWRASFGTIEAMPDGKKAEQGSVYMKIDITRTPADQQGTVKTAKPTELKLEDRKGRSWTTVFDDSRAEEELQVGKESTLIAYARVPEAQAAEVDLLLRPSNYRSDIPTDKLLTTKLEPDSDVVRIRR
ncbi:hypothetical protein [Nonomuraea typhae]|uniref:DUF4352 domain-containing protein n=1 Tax=Nonomuraea typhae TaxID=2603600 RepID=A0ABW7Z1E1_9ACTN